MAQQSGERTEKATSRRRQRAKTQGQFAYSQELTSAMTLAACAATTFYFLHSPEGFRAFFASLLENAASKSSSELIRQAGTYFLIVAAPIFAAAIISALAVGALLIANFPAAAFFTWSAIEVTTRYTVEIVNDIPNATVNVTAV